MKKIALLMSVLFVLLAFTACQGAKDVLDETRKTLQATGRDYGKTYELQEGETAKTTFFDCTINSAKIVKEVDDYVAENEDHSFLILNVTILNTFQDDAKIPMFWSDFELTWDDIDEATVFPEENFTKDQLPDEYEIFKNKSRTGNLIFVVPSDVSKFQLKYNEIWDDDFEGNTYFMNFTAKSE